VFKTSEEAVAAIGKYFEIESVTIKETKMSTLTFTVAALYPVKEGFHTASIKTDTGKYISVWPNDAHLFQEGGNYSAVCGEFQKADGNINYTVKSPGKGGNIVNNGGAPQQTSTAPQQAPAPSMGIPKDEIISRLAIAKSCIESNQSQADADSWMNWVLKKQPESPQQMETNVSSDDPLPF
jgi:hypothetical protein